MYGSGAKNFNFMDAHQVFSPAAWEYFIFLSLMHGNIPRSFTECMNYFYGNISMAFDYKYCMNYTPSFGFTGSNST
jgi:hypothetical protein